MQTADIVCSLCLRVCVLDSSNNRCVIGARVVWGIDGIDRDGTDETDSDDVGLVEYHSAFDLTRPEAQQVCSATYSMLHSTHSHHRTHTHQFVYDTCLELQQKASSLHLKPGEMDCFMMVVNACTRTASRRPKAHLTHHPLPQDYRNWRVSRRQSFPAPPDEFVATLREFLYRPQHARRFIPKVNSTDSSSNCHSC